MSSEIGKNSSEEMKDLLKGAKERDTGSQLALIKQFKPLMLSLIRKYVYEKDAVDDYLSEGTIILLEAVESFDACREVPFSAYLKQELFHYFVGQAKKPWTHVSYDQNVCEEGNFTLLDMWQIPGTEFPDVYAHRDELERLMHYLKELTPRRRWILVEHYFKGRSLREIAESVEMNPNALSKLHRRAISDLRTLMGKEMVN